MRQRGDSSAGARAALDAEYVVVWLVALVVVAGITGAVVAYGDDVRQTTPDSAFVVSFDEDARTLTVAHNGGDAIRDRSTHRLSVVVTDADADVTDRVVWAADETWYADRGSGFPVSEGDSLRIDDPTVDSDGDGNLHDADGTVGFELDANDTVAVEWEGDRRGGKQTTETLLNATLARGDDGTLRFAVGE
jgi:hypothetical protein